LEYNKGRYFKSGIPIQYFTPEVVKTCFSFVEKKPNKMKPDPNGKSITIKFNYAEFKKICIKNKWTHMLEKNKIEEIGKIFIVLPPLYTTGPQLIEDLIKKQKGEPYQSLAMKFNFTSCWNVDLTLMAHKRLTEMLRMIRERYRSEVLKTSPPDLTVQGAKDTITIPLDADESFYPKFYGLPDQKVQAKKGEFNLEYCGAKVTVWKLDKELIAEKNPIDPNQQEFILKEPIQAIHKHNVNFGYDPTEEAKEEFEKSKITFSKMGPEIVAQMEQDIKDKYPDNQPVITEGYYSSIVEICRVYKQNTGGNSITFKLQTMREYLKPKSDMSQTDY
jgi:hypothetical protein